MSNNNILRKLFVVILFAVCSANLFAQQYNPDFENQSILDTNIQEEILYGKCDMEGVKNSEIFRDFYQNSLDEYEIDSALIIGQSDLLDDIEVTMVFATWCSDSQRELPRFLEILSIMDYPMDDINIIALDANKNIEGIDITDLNIEFVPTFILYKNGVELGRIIESPDSTLENDLLNIINTKQ